MTEIVGTMLLVEEGEPSACESCGEVADLRPYGPGGKNICFACGQRDPEGTLERMCLSLEVLMQNVTRVVGPDGEVIELGRADDDFLPQGDQHREETRRRS